MDEDSPPTIVTEVIDSIAIIRFNRPLQRNPLSLSTLTDLKATLAQLTPREEIKAVVFTGTADIFASGANIRELSQLDPEAAFDFSTFGQQLFQTIADARQVTIAAINGYCMGGALDLALACDIRVASKTAVFSHPGVKLGIITGWGGTQRLPRIIGRAQALEFFVTGSRYTSTTSLQMGLISGVGDPVLKYAVECARSAIAAPSFF
jgi:enoyl-CoA hydratase/carnithine racemase